MDVIFRGQLSYEVRLSHVLDHVRERQAKGVTLLFLRSSDQAIEGVVSIWNAQFVTSAQVYRSDVSGYPALKQLFTLATGDFAYSRPENQEIEGIDHDLNIELKRLVPLIPFLPEDFGELFDEESLLDNVFTAKLDPAKPSEMKTPESEPSPNSESDQSVWKSFRALIAANKPEKKKPEKKHAGKKHPEKKKAAAAKPTKIDWQVDQPEYRGDARATLRLKRQKSKGGAFALFFNILGFWTRTEFLVFASALITFVGLLWLCEKIGPYVGQKMKATSTHIKFKLPGKLSF
ncbi:MAG: hypothetical protein C5B53_07945 [Candidatus Melainabacteria bacterium]|nr:MAG: hypothetical protein C5B53_07945 [Candidatus Melainabacteria bacterium]